MVTYRCDVCGREFHDGRHIVPGNTYRVERGDKTIDHWYGDVCKDCHEEMRYVGQRAVMDWIMDTRKKNGVS